MELHANAGLDGVSHAGEVFVRKIHRSCNSPLCSVCVFSGLGEAIWLIMLLRGLEVTSKRFGLATAILFLSPPVSDWGLFEFDNAKFRA